MVNRDCIQHRMCRDFVRSVRVVFGNNDVEMLRGVIERM